MGWLFNLMLAGQPWLQVEDCEDVVEVPIGFGSKLDQNWIKIGSKLDQNGSKWIKMDQNGSNLTIN